MVLAVTSDALILGLQTYVDIASGCANVGGNNNCSVAMPTMIFAEARYLICLKCRGLEIKR